MMHHAVVFARTGDSKDECWPGVVIDDSLLLVSEGAMGING